MFTPVADPYFAGFRVIVDEESKIHALCIFHSEIDPVDAALHVKVELHRSRSDRIAHQTESIVELDAVRVDIGEGAFGDPHATVEVMQLVVGRRAQVPFTVVVVPDPVGFGMTGVDVLRLTATET